MSGTYQDLKVWQLAMDLVYLIYAYTKGFPHHEIYALTNQMRRAAVSIPSNIAEGKGRNGRKELLHFLSNARGSLHELETQVLIAAHLNYLTLEQRTELLDRIAEVGRTLSGFMSFAERATNSQISHKGIARACARALSLKPCACYSYASASIGSFCAALKAG